LACFVSLVSIRVLAVAGESERLTFGSISEEVRGAAISMIQVIADPERFDGKRIAVTGYLNYDPHDEVQELCFSSESVQRAIPANCLYFVPDNKALGLSDEELASLSGQFVEAQGVVRAEVRGPWKFCAAGLVEVDFLFLSERSHQRYLESKKVSGSP
jgi:hypothetical protein